jgi:putative chitinase
MKLTDPGKKAFFDSVRTSIFGGRLTDRQVDGMTAVLAGASPQMPLNHLAYCLATYAWETGLAMQPVEEKLSYSAARLRQVWPKRFPTLAVAKQYANNPKALANKVYGGRMGNRLGTDDGYHYRGRGPVQLTGRDNYAKAGKYLGKDLLSDPGYALQSEIAVGILLGGMAEGWFTGKRLSDYDNRSGYNAKGARAIINGTDNAANVAGYYKHFFEALHLMRSEDPAVMIPLAPLPPPPDIPALEPAEKPLSFWARVTAFFA